jgi:hypothetical protein
MDATAAKADALGKKNPTITVKADTSGASSDLDKAAAKADALGKKTETVTVKADTSDVSQKISDLTSGPFSLLKTAIVGLGPAAVPVLGTVTAAVLPLSAAVGSAAAGLAAFGTVSKLVLTQAGTAATAASTAQATYTAAIAKAAGQYTIASAAAKTHTQQVAALAAEHKADATAAVAQAAALSTAYSGMSSQQIALSKQVGDLDKAYKGMLTSVTPLVSSALVPWMKDVQNLLQYIKPLISPVAALFKSWGDELNRSLTGNTANITKFMDAFAGRSATNIRLFGDALVEFAKGAGSLIHDVAPNLAGAADGVLKLAQSFAAWAGSQKAADDIKAFFSWAQTNAPTVRKFLDDLNTTIGHLVIALASAGPSDLKVLTAGLSALAALPSGAIVAIADGYVALSLGLRAAAVATTLYEIASKDAAGYTLLMRIQFGLLQVQEKAVALWTGLVTAATWLADAAETAYVAVMLLADAASLPLIVVIGGIVLAVAALALGIYELATHWNTVWHDILAVSQDVWGWIKNNWPLLTAILLGPIAVAVLEIVQHWDTIKDAFSAVSAFIAADWKAFTSSLLAPVAAIVHGISVAWAAIEAPFEAVIDWIKTHWQDTLVLLTGLLGVAILVIIHFWPQITTAVETVFNGIASYFTTWWATATSRFTAAANILKGVLTAAWSAISTALKAAWAAIAAYFTSWWNAEVAYFKGPITAIENALKAAWSAITSVAKTAWGAISSYFSSWWNSELSTFKNDAAAIGNALKAAWDAIESTAKSVFGGILTYFGGFWSALKTGFATAVSGVATAWNKLETIVKTPVQWVVTNVYDKLIMPFWNATAGAIGLTKLPKLAGGGMVPGGYSPVDNQLVWMRSGEGVLQPGAVMALGGPAFIDAANRTYGDVPVGSSGAGHYASGGTAPGNVGQGLHTGTTAEPSGSAPAGLGSIGGILSGLVHDAAGVISEVETGVFDALSSVGTRLIDGAVKLIPGSGGVATAMRDYPPKIWSAFLSWVTAHAGNGGDIVKYAESFLGKIPYVWGGTSLSSAGADCSGFTGSVLSHFGYDPPRTSEAQGSWVKRAGPQAGGLAFYHSPAGGADPGHVAIVASGSQVVSQGGGMGPKMMALHAMPLLWTGIPPGGFKSGSGGGSTAMAGGGSASANQALGQRMAAAMGWTGAEWAALNAVEMREAGWSTTARNASSGAYGIAQFISGPSEYAQYGGSSTTAGGQIAGFLNYVKERYGDPIAAEAHEAQYGWYDQGGWLQPGMTMVMNATGHPEPVLNPDQWDRLTSAVGSGDGIGDKLDRIAGLLMAGPRATAGGVSEVLNGTAHTASFRARYPRNN